MPGPQSQEAREALALRRADIKKSGGKDNHCRYCDKKFGRESDAVRHEKSVVRVCPKNPARDERRPYECNLCSKSFSRLDAAWRHTRWHNDKCTSNTCEIAIGRHKPGTEGAVSSDTAVPLHDANRLFPYLSMTSRLSQEEPLRERIQKVSTDQYLFLSMGQSRIV